MYIQICIVYYMVNIGMLVNRRMELKKQGKLQEELVNIGLSRFRYMHNVWNKKTNNNNNNNIFM